MFEQTFVAGKTRKPFTVAMGLMMQVLVVCIMIIVPLVFTDTLTAAKLTGILFAPAPPPAPPPPAPQPPPPRKTPPKVFCALCVPKQIPKGPLDQPDKELSPPQLIAACPNCVPGSIPGNGPGGPGIPNLGAPTSPPPPPVAPPPYKPIVPKRFREGGKVEKAKLIKQVTPQYPPLAKQARISGAVRFTAIIGIDGTIQHLELVSGHPLLVEAARQAVSQWLYKPTLLNGEVIEVVTQIDVSFNLSQ